MSRGGVCPGGGRGVVCLGGCVQGWGVVCPGEGCGSRGCPGDGVSREGSVSRGFCIPPRYGKTGAQYASYWNAFLLLTYVYRGAGPLLHVRGIDSPPDDWSPKSKLFYHRSLLSDVTLSKNKNAFQ